jgi:hypothetical protein
MFDLYGNERLTEWKKFRDSLEISNDPLTAVAELWARAPFVSPYLDPQTPSEWPDPWHLVLDNKLDELAISLGMLYTLKLTQRFIATDCEIHMSMPSGKTDSSFYLIVDKKYLLNYEPRVVHDLKTSGVRSSTICSWSQLHINTRL